MNNVIVEISHPPVHHQALIDIGSVGQSVLNPMGRLICYFCMRVSQGEITDDVRGPHPENEDEAGDVGDHVIVGCPVNSCHQHAKVVSMSPHELGTTIDRPD